MTRLEQLDAYRTLFEDRLEQVRTDAGASWWRLGSSLFYPTSGGQPHDEGDLGSGDARWRVRDVRLSEGAVWHRVEPLAGSAELHPGTPVWGRIDWHRRFRHMQRHTAQHLLSQAFLRTDAAFVTRSVSLTGPDLTVDLGGEPGDDDLHAAETLVNEVASRALAVRAFEIDESELERFPLRRPPKVRGRLRVVEVGDWERSACGGTHVRSTAEVLPVLVLGRERVRGGDVRVTFRAGLEAIQGASSTHRAAAAAAVRLSSRVEELPDRVAALQADAAAARREAAAARGRWASALADDLLRETVPASGVRPGGPEHPVVARTLQGDDVAVADELADALAARGASAVVAALEPERVRLVTASGAGIDVRPALVEALGTLGGRGGGRPERAQGAAPRADGAEERLARSLDRAVARLAAAGRPGAATEDAPGGVGVDAAGDSAP